MAFCRCYIILHLAVAEYLLGDVWHRFLMQRTADVHDSHSRNQLCQRVCTLEYKHRTRQHSSEHFLCAMRLLLLVAFIASLSACSYGAVLGIDLGTNSYKAAVIRGGGIDVLLNELSKRKTPNAVAIHPDEGVYYGDAALTYMLRAPERGICSVGLHLGREDTPVAPFEASARGAPELRLSQEADNISAEALASLLFSKIRSVAGSAREVALSVPAWYGHTQRRALVDAAELAGLTVLSLVNDGTALAVAYATLREAKPTADTDPAEHVLILDIGAWSSRATLISIRSAKVETKGKVRFVPVVSVLQHAWEENAAGEAIDALVAEHLKKSIPHKLNQRAHTKLLREAKRVKEVLSANSNTVAQVEGLVDDWNLRVPITRKEFEALLEPLLPRIVAPALRALGAANVSVAELSAVELVGGGGRVPAVQAALSAALGGRALEKRLNGDEALVEGAALYAASLSSGLRVKEVRLRDGTPHAFNAQLDVHPEADGEVEALPEGGYNVALFKKGAKLGGRRTVKIFTTEPFTVRITHAEPGTLTHGVPSSVANYSITGFDALPATASSLAPVRVVLQFRMSSSGLVELDRVHAEVTELVVETPPPEIEKEKAKEEEEKKKEKEKDAGDKEKETSADAEKEKEADKAAVDSEAAAEEAKEAASATPQPTATPITGSEKRRVRHVVLHSSMVLPRVLMTAADRKEAEAVLGRIKARDEARKKRDAAKNGLETEVYALRERLEEQATATFSTEKEREALAASIADNSAFLDDSTSATPTEEYSRREKALKALYAPIAKRIVEEDLRPRAVKAANAALASLPSLLANASATLNVTDEEVTGALTDVLELLKWLEEVTKAQSSKAKHEDGAFTSDDVAERTRKVEKRARRVLSRPVKRPPPPPPAPTNANATNTEAPASEGTGADAGAGEAAQESREQEAIKEEKGHVPEN